MRESKERYLNFSTVSQLLKFESVVPADTSVPGNKPSSNDGFNQAKLDISRVPRKEQIRNVLSYYRTGQGVKLSAKLSKNKNETLITVSELNSLYKNANNLINFNIIKKMNRDPVIAFNYAVLSSIIRSLPYTVSSKDEMQQHFLRYILEKHYDSMMTTFCTSIFNGFSLQQLVWGKKHVNFSSNYVDDKGELLIEELFQGVIDDIVEVKSIDPGSSNLYFYVDFKTELLTRIEQYDSEKKDQYISIPKSQLVHHSTGDPFNKVFGKSRYSNILAAYEVAKIVYRYLLKIMDDNSDCPVEVGYPTGSTHDSSTGKMIDNYELAQTLADDVAKNTEFVIPTDLHPDTNTPKWHVKVKTDWEKKNGEALQKYLKFLNNEKTIGLFIPPQFSPQDSEDSAGTYQVAMELLMFVEEPLVSEIEKVFKTDFLDRFLAMNFPLDKIVDYRFEIDKSLFNRRQIMKELVLNLTRINGQHISSGILPEMTPDLEAIFSQLNIPVKPTMEVYRNLTNANFDGDSKTSDEKDTNDKRNKQYRMTPRASRAGKKKTLIPGA